MAAHDHAHHEGHDHDHHDHAHDHDPKRPRDHSHHEHAPYDVENLEKDQKRKDDLAATERKQARRLMVVVGVIALFFVFELIGAKKAQSDVLEADAYHLLMDVFALGISLAAMRVASRHPSDRFTFGLRRAESIAALINGVLVLALCTELVRDGIQDLAHHAEPKPGLMLIVASAALVVNGFSAWLLHGAMHVHVGHDHGHHGHDHAHAHAHGDADAEGPHPQATAAHLNLRGAWLHLMGDALGSLAAFGAGLAIRMGAPSYIDPIASFFVVAILLVGALRLLRDAGLVLLEAAPARLPVSRVKQVVLAHPSVTGLHALHVWSLGTGHEAVSVHVTAEGHDPGLARTLSDHLRRELEAEFVTVQVDVDGACLSVDAKKPE